MYIEEMNVCKAYPFLCFSLLLINKKNVTLKRECVSAAKFEDNVFIKKKIRVLEVAPNAGRNLRVDVVLHRSRGFLRLNLCASAIFVVGTSGIPPKLNYRSVQSYKHKSALRS